MDQKSESNPFKTDIVTNEIYSSDLAGNSSIIQPVSDGYVDDVIDEHSNGKLFVNMKQIIFYLLLYIQFFIQRLKASKKGIVRRNPSALDFIPFSSFSRSDSKPKAVW